MPPRLEWRRLGSLVRAIPSSEAHVVTFHEGRTWDLSPYLQLLAYPVLIRLYVYDGSFEGRSQRGAADRI